MSSNGKVLRSFVQRQMAATYPPNTATLAPSDIFLASLLAHASADSTRGVRMPNRVCTSAFCRRGRKKHNLRWVGVKSKRFYSIVYAPSELHGLWTRRDASVCGQRQCISASVTCTRNAIETHTQANQKDNYASFVFREPYMQRDKSTPVDSQVPCHA